MADDLRERIRRGDPAAFNDPALPLLLLGGVAMDAAREGAMVYLAEGGAVQPWLLDLARAWWHEQADGTALCRLLGHLGAQAGEGSDEHRRAVLVACLCARTALRHAGCWREEVEGCLEVLERWAWGDRTSNPAVGQERIRSIWQTTPTHPGLSGDDSSAASCAVCAASAAIDTYVAHDPTVGLLTAASAAADACGVEAGQAVYAGEPVDDDYAAEAARAASAIEVAREAHLSALADLIRAAVPVGSLLEASRGRRPARAHPAW